MIAHQEIGDQFSGLYYVEQSAIKLTAGGKDYTDMLLRDRSGSRPVKFWGKVDGVERGGWVFAAIFVEEYHGRPSMVARNLEPESPPQDMVDHVPVYDQEDVGELADRFDVVKEAIVGYEGDDKTCSRMVEATYDGSFFSRFVEAPGGVRPYYGCVGGLLASVVRVAETARAMAALYPMGDREMAVLLSAALLHRAGAPDAYGFIDCIPAQTARGVLIGVKGLTLCRLTMAMRKAMAPRESDKVPVAFAATAMRVLHAIMSHDAVGVLPATPEALVMNAAWKADAECVEAMDFIANDQNVDDEFTAWDPSMRRRYYRGG